MRIRPLAIVLVTSMVGAAAFAVFSVSHTSTAGAADAVNPPASPVFAGTAQAQALPPNHPSIGGHGSASHGGSSSHGGSPHGGAAFGGPAESGGDPPAISWKAPASWQSRSNPNAIRIATYHVPSAAGAADEAELSVSRAGGAVDANVQRWLGQFEDAGKDTRTEETVHGLKITIVQVSGTFTGSGMQADDGQPKKDWALLGAIVETPGSPYFFKMTGPAASVAQARAAFDAMLTSITPAS